MITTQQIQMMWDLYFQSKLWLFNTYRNHLEQFKADFWRSYVHMWAIKWLCYCPSLPLATHKCLHSWEASGSNIQKPTNTCVTIPLSLCSDLNRESFWVVVSQQGKTGLQAFPWCWKLWVLKAKLWSRDFSWDRCFIFCVCVWYGEPNWTEPEIEALWIIPRYWFLQLLAGVTPWWHSGCTGHSPVLKEFCPMTFAGK